MKLSEMNRETKIAIATAFAALWVVGVGMKILFQPPPNSTPPKITEPPPNQWGVPYSNSGSVFESDEERLEYRSRNRLPMTDEDVKYEQRKVMEALEKMKASNN